MALELVGGALLSASLQVTFEKLASGEILDYFRKRKLDERLLNKLNIMLLSIDAVVDDAELKQIGNPPVRAWLDAVKDAVLEAEDLLDEIDAQVSKRQLEGESQTCNCKVRNFFNASFDKKIESSMQQMLDNLEYLASKRDMLGLKQARGLGVGSGGQVSQKLPSTSLLGETVVYGRDDDKENIFNWLMSDTEHKLSIISIVGMGGMGKTTLAQHLYNDSRMEGQFDIKAWVCVSDEFDVFKVTRAILEAITGSTDDSRDLNMLHNKLKERLSERKFLLILDDIWNENCMQWEALQTPLNYGARGSKILVTTRSMKVASIMRSTKTCQLMQLQEEHCWQLFTKHAFQDENPQINLEFKEIGRKIIEKCQGLPLALKTIGSLLHTKSSLLEWKSILTSEIWDLPEEDNNIIPALMLSYHHLPSHLKRCFAYCSLFPKDYEFEKEHLILLWMAENFLKCPQQSKTMEEVGEHYFNDLLLRSFFQKSSGNETHFVMHDLLNDLAKYVSGEFCYRLEVQEAQNISIRTRHVSVLRKSYGVCGWSEICKAKRLRTFLSNCSHSSDLMHDFFSKFKVLRVLSVFGSSNFTKVPDSIGNLKHLHYLDLSFTKIKKLSESTCLLYDLQVLKLTHCRYLEELPLNLHKLTNLRYLDFFGTEVRKMPKYMGKLKNLQVLTSFYVGKCSKFNIQQLGELSLRGTLSIWELQNVISPLDALAANLKTKIHLVKLELEWSANHDKKKNPQKEREVLEKLQPSRYLRELSIRNYGGTQFPDWFGDNPLTNVVSLVLSGCENCVLLPPLGLLSSLENLHIKGLPRIVVIGSEFYGNGNGEGTSSPSTIPFASLKTLTFCHMEGWEDWECKILMGVAAFPCLEKLYIKDCPKLKEHLPKRLPCLKELTIDNCQNLMASFPWAQAIDELHLNNCGMLQFDYHPSNLKILKIGGQDMEASLLKHIISDISSEILDITDCPNMNIIPTHQSYNFLENLCIRSSCDSLRTFPLDFFPKLRELSLQDCSNLEMISQDHEHNLTHLSIYNCPKFVSLPERMHILLPSVTTLRIDDCPQLEFFSSDGGCPPNLKRLKLRDCSSKFMASLKWALGTNTSLVYLSIGNMDVESFPNQGLLPISLTTLWIDCCRNLKKLDYEGLCHLSSLKELDLINCPRLQCLPDEGLPKSISYLVIVSCPLLKQRCQIQKGQDWGKISHIQRIMIDGHEEIGKDGEA